MPSSTTTSIISTSTHPSIPPSPSDFLSWSKLPIPQANGFITTQTPTPTALYIGTSRGVVEIYRMKPLLLSHTLVPSNQPGSVYSIAANGSKLAVGFQNGYIDIYSDTTKQHTLSLASTPIHIVQWISKSTVIAATTTSQAFAVTSGKAVKVHDTRVESSIFDLKSHGEKWAVVTPFKVAVFASTTFIVRFPFQKADCGAVDWHPDGQSFVSSHDGVLWNHEGPLFTPTVLLSLDIGIVSLSYLTRHVPLH